MTAIHHAPQTKNLGTPDETRPFAGHGHADAVELAGRTVLRAVFEPGWKWSVDVKPIAKTDLCMASHLGYCVEGRMRVTMSDGTELEMGPGDVFAIPPGHDAETLGDTACVALDFGEIAAYAKE